MWNKDLKRIVKPVMDAQPDAPAAIIADIMLIEHRDMLHAWLTGQIEREKKRLNEPYHAPHRKGRRGGPPDKRKGKTGASYVK